MKSFSGIWSDELEAAIKENVKEPYEMSLVDGDADSFIFAVFEKSGIRPDKICVQGRIEFVIPIEQVPEIVKILIESDDENNYYLGSGICQTLEIELIQKIPITS